MIGNPEVEKELKELLEKADADLQPLRKAYAELYWEASLSGLKKDFAKLGEAELALRKKLGDSELYEELTTRLNDPGVQDVLIRRWAHLLRLEMVPNRLSDEILTDIIAREKKIEAKVNTFRPKLDGKAASMNDVKEILRNSKDSDERRAAWEASKEIGPEIAEDIRELVRVRNVSARSLGYPDHYRMNLELQEIDEARLFSSLGRFSNLSEDNYRRIKARLDRLLADMFDVEAVDLAPWHYSDPFFQEVPPVFGIETDSIFAGKDILKWSTSYFKGMGLPINKVIEKGDYEERKGKYPNAYCLDVDREGDVRVLMNVKNNTEWASTALHEFGHAAYDLNIDKKLPHTLRQPAHIAVTEGIAMFFDRMVKDMEWLMTMFKLKGDKVRELEKPLAEMRRVELAILSRWILVMVHFERGLYRDPDHDQQMRWWDLVERFQLIRAPKTRADKADWATKIHIASSPVYYHNYLLGAWIASQLESAMIRDLKLEDPALWYAEPRVGKWLKENLFQEGARWEFNELIKNITGSTVQPDDFISKYFR